MTTIRSSLSSRLRSRIALAAAALPLVFSLAACGASSSGSEASPASGGGSTTGGASSTDSEAAKLVPTQYKDKTINIAIATDYPPYHYADKNGKVIGFDPDFAVAIAENMGVKYNLQVSSFDAIIPGIVANRYDIAVPGYSITPERAKVLDFVTYVVDESSYVSSASADIDIKAADGLCGHSWAAQKGTQEESLLQAQAKSCDSKGLKKLNYQSFPTNTDALTAVLSGRADGASATYSQLAYASKQQPSKFKIADYKQPSKPLAMGLKKGSPLGPAVIQAVKDLQADGTYAKILAKNGVADMSYDKPALVTQ